MCEALVTKNSKRGASFRRSAAFKFFSVDDLLTRD